MLYAVAGTVARPGATFKTISRVPDRYLASSVAVFAAACIVSALPSATIWLEPGGGIFGGFGGGMLAYAMSLTSAVLQNLLLIAAIFWIGGRYGGNRRFKDVFPTLSFCLIPLAVLAAASMVGMHLFDPLELMRGSYVGGGSLDQDPDLAPSYALDFAGGASTFLIQNAFSASFMAWALVLFVKATKVSHGFGTGKAVGILALAIVATYAFAVALGILKGLFLQHAWL